MPIHLPDRIGLIGDVHSDAGALQTALDWLDAQDIESILCTGDIVDGIGDANACCDLLRERHIPTVRGNHDRWFFSGAVRNMPDDTPESALSEMNRDWLAALPATLSCCAPNQSILLCHGLDENDLAYFRSDDFGYALEVNEPLQKLLNQRQYNFVLSGHSHECMALRFDYVTFINPGSLNRTYGGTFIVVDFALSQRTAFRVDDTLQIQIQGLYSI